MPSELCLSLQVLGYHRGDLGSGPSRGRAGGTGVPQAARGRKGYQETSIGNSTQVLMYLADLTLGGVISWRQLFPVLSLCSVHGGGERRWHHGTPGGRQAGSYPNAPASNGLKPQCGCSPICDPEAKGKGSAWLHPARSPITCLCAALARSVQLYPDPDMRCTI